MHDVVTGIRLRRTEVRFLADDGREDVIDISPPASFPKIRLLVK